MKKALQIGGIAAGVVLIGFGIASIVLAIKGGNTVTSNLSQEFITGTLLPRPRDEFVAMRESQSHV